MNYSEEEKRAIEYWKRDIKLYNYNTQLASEHYAQIVLNLIQKQDKEIHKLKIIIENMAEDLVQDCNYEELEYQKQKIIQHFKKEVENG